MPAPTASPLPNPFAAEDPADDVGLRSRARLERQLAVLDRLAEVGLDVAEALGRRARDLVPGPAERAAGEAVGAPEPVDDALEDAATDETGGIALAYARVARAVRLTFALQSRLVDDFHALGQAVARARDAADALARQARPERAQTVARIVERLIEAEIADDEHAVEAADAASRWLNDESLSGALDRPFSHIVADICRDLGLDPDWAALAREGWARDEAAGRGPGVPPPPPGDARTRQQCIREEAATLRAAKFILDAGHGRPRADRRSDQGGRPGRAPLPAAASP